MKKNYTLITPKKSIKNSFLNFNIVVAFLFVLFGMSSSFGQVAITKPNLTINTCVFPSAYSVLGQIQIQENADGNFSSNAAARTLILSAPANFEFKPGTGTLNVRTVRDINIAATMTVTASTITITYNCPTATATDRLRLDNIEVRAINFASTGDITRTGGTGTVSGLINGTTLTNTLTSLDNTPTITTNPANSSIGIGANTSFTVVGNNTPTSYTWQVSTNGGGTWTTVNNGGVYSNATTGTLNITGATLGMNGYLYRASATNACGTSAYSTNALLTVSNIVLVSGTGVNNVTCGTNSILRDHAGTGNYGNNRNDWSVLNAGTGATITISGTYATENTWDFVRIYDGSGVGGTLLATYTNSGTINYTGNPGQTLTLQFTSDGSNINTGFEVNVSFSGACSVPCVTPSAQPTALALTPNGTTINGTFTAASPAPNSYLVVRNTTGIAPSPAPVNGTTYGIGSTALGGTNVVVDNDSNTSFSATSLTPFTRYYFFVYSINNFCTAGPLYLTTLPLTGNALTDYCSPTSFSPSGLYISNVSFVGALQDPPVNASTFNATGFQDFTTLPTKAIQAQGEGINIVARAFGTILQRGTWKAWVDWNKNGSFEPATEEVYNIQGFVGADATFGFVIPLLTPPGDYRIRIRVNNGTNGASETYGFNFTPCDNFTSVGPTTNYGETEDYLFTVVAKCNSLITTVMSGSNCGAGTVNLQATATSGVTEFRWYTSASGGSYTTSPPSGTSTSFTTPSLLSTTNYYVTAWNGSCESQVRTLVVAKINQTPIVTFSPSNPIICGENTIVQLTANGDKEITYLIDEDFEVGGLGLFTNLNNDTNNATRDAITAWQSRTSAYVPNTNVWFPAISSGFGTNKFALAYSDAKLPNIPNNTVENSLTLINSVNTNTFLNLTLNLKMYYSRYYPNGYIDPLSDEYVNIEVSTDNGVTYPNIVQSFTSDVGIGSKFAELSFNLSAYINVPNLKIRIRHRSYAGTGWLPDGVAVDDVKLFGEKPLNTAFTYNTAIVDAYTNAAATIPYTSGTPVTTIYIKPTLIQLESALFTIPVSTTLSNGCSATGSINVTNNTKMFSAGTTGTDWNNAANWKPNGVPNANNCVIIYDNDVNITGTNYSALGLNLTVKPTGNLNISSSNTAIITDFVTVEPLGVFEIENDGSLVQINNVSNIGNITYKRIAPGIRGFDYVYWSSPVTGQSLAGIYTSPAQGPKYSWNTTITNGNGGQGNWVNPPATMAVGSGYIVRGSSSFGMAATAINSTFIGVPNNGTIPVTVQRGNYTGAPYPGANGIPINNLDDNYNLLGNPYPSALNGLQFLSDNSAVIEGNVKLWKHGFSPASTNANPFYASFAYNYSASDYTTINFTGPTTPLLTDIIKSGQAFFVEMKDGASGNNVVNFRNTQRSNSGTPYANDAFFRTTNAEGITSEVIERNRIWLDIVDANNIAETTLLGYITGATEAKESAFDAIASTLPMGIYSVIADETFVIQGRSLPFNNNDQVAIGFNVPNAGNYHIAINTIDGLFLDTTQNIYLEDKITNVIHNLKTSPYSFTTATGIHNERFVLRYTNQTLGTEDFTANDIKVYANESINVIATNQTIKSVRVYDLLGRILGNFNNVNATTFSTTTIVKTQTALIVEVVLENGAKQSHKVIF